MVGLLPIPPHPMQPSFGEVTKPMERSNTIGSPFHLPAFSTCAAETVGQSLEYTGIGGLSQQESQSPCQ